MMHDWCPVSLLCTRCGMGFTEFVNWNGPCFPTPMGTVFTIQISRMIEAINESFFSEDDQSRRPDA